MEPRRDGLDSGSDATGVMTQVWQLVTALLAVPTLGWRRRQGGRVAPSRRALLWVRGGLPAPRRRPPQRPHNDLASCSASCTWSPDARALPACDTACAVTWIAASTTPCLPALEHTMPSCEVVPRRIGGRCEAAFTASPIPGGGYCYCDEQCDNDFTDNNSTADAARLPMEVCSRRRATALQGCRTQAQAVNAFVAHYVIEREVLSVLNAQSTSLSTVRGG